MPRIKQNVSTVKRRFDTADKYRKTNTYDWIDPFPEVHGTKPEKMVYAALTQAGVPFYFLNDISFSIPEIEFFKEYQADFIIPSAKTIIEVQGSFWHSKPTAIESDAYKFAVYESFGYKALAWWDYDIFTNLSALLAESGILTVASGVNLASNQSTELTPIKRTKIDTSKGIRTMNARKRKPYRTFIGASKRKSRKALTSYGTR